MGEIDCIHFFFFFRASSAQARCLMSAVPVTPVVSGVAYISALPRVGLALGSDWLGSQNPGARLSTRILLLI